MSGPIAATRPMPVLPGVMGRGKVKGVLPPRMACKLRWDWTHSTLTTTLPIVGWGVGTVMTTRGWPGPSQTRARIVSGRG